MSVSLFIRYGSVITNKISGMPFGVSDEAVRRAVSNLRHCLSEEGTETPITTVHKSGYIARFSPPPAVESNADPPVLPQPVATGGRPRRWWRAALLVLAPVLIFGAGTGLIEILQSQDAPSPAAGPDALRTIAVLPFAIPGDNRDTSYFSEGIAAELLGILGRVPAFRVTARSSSFQFRDQSFDAREIGRQLGVHYLVEGLVQREGERVRIVASLVDTRSGFQLWSGRYERTLADLLEVQEDIATQIARELQVVLVRGNGKTPRSRAPTSVAAHMAYLEGLKAMNSGVIADLQQVIGLFQNAIDLDPGYAAAQAQLAGALLQYAQIASLTSSEREDALNRARVLLRHALELDPDLGLAYLQRARLADSPAEQEADLRRGLELSPSNAAGYEQLAEVEFFELGNTEEGLALIDKARALNPLRPRTHHLKSYMMLATCQLDEAEALERQALRADPRFRSAYAILGTISAARGDLAQQVLYLEHARRLDPDSPWLRSQLVQAYLGLDGPTSAALANRPETAEARLYLLLFNGQLQQAAASILAAGSKGMSDLDPNDRLELLVQAAMASGEFDEARNFLAGRPNELTDTAVPRYWYEFRQRLNLELLRSGPQPSPTERDSLLALRDMIAERTATAPACEVGKLSFYLALADTVLGDQERALQVMQAAAAADRLPGWWWWLARVHPGFSALRDRADFQALIAAGRAGAARQRDRLEGLKAADASG